MNQLTQYRAFIAVFNAQSISGAAELLNLSAPAISKQLTALERRLELVLFERAHRKLIPTEQGKIFYFKCIDILQSIDDAENEARLADQEISGTLKVTLPKALLNSGLLNILVRFTDKHPQLKYSIDVSEQVQDLQQKNFDVAFRLGNVANNNLLIATKLNDVEPIFCASPCYIERNGEPLFFSELNRHTLCLPPYSELSQSIRYFFKQQGLQHLTPTHEVNDVSAAQEFVENGLGVGLFLRCSIKTQLEQGSLLPLFEQSPLPQKTLSMVTKKSARSSQRLQLFKAFLKQQY